MRVFVTGGTGFVGGHLLRELSSRGYDVVALRRASSPSTETPENVSWVTGDVTNRDSLNGALEGCTVVFHAAAAVNGPQLDWDSQYKVGVEGTQNVIDAAAAAGVERFVHLSSSAVYLPPSPGAALDEESPLAGDIPNAHPYVRQKVMAEFAAWRADTDGRLAVTVVRPPRVLGPGDPNLLSAIGNLLNASAGRILNDSAARVPVVVVEDLVAGIVDAAEKPAAAHRAYNLGSSRSITKAALAEAFARSGFVPPGEGLSKRAVVAGLRSSVLAGNLVLRSSSGGRTRTERLLQTGTRGKLGARLVDHTYDSSLAETELGWRGDADIEEAINRSVAWARARR